MLRSSVAPERRAKATPLAIDLLSTSNSPEPVESPGSSLEDDPYNFTHWMKMEFGEDRDISSWDFSEEIP